MIIGICGKSGCGKTTLANNIEEIIKCDSVHLDVDLVGHSVLLLPEVREELINSFGKKIINNNCVDRKKLANIVFNSRNEMQKLSLITWKYMEIAIDNFIKLNNDKVIVLDWILLPKTKYFDMCDIKILMDTSYDIRKQRAIKRDNITENEFDLREKASIDFNENQFDYILRTNNINEIKELGRKL